MRTFTPLLLCLGCVDPGRQPVRIEVELQAFEGSPTSGDWRIEFDVATVRVSDLILREPPDGRWGDATFDDRPDDPLTTGVAGAAWAGSRKVDLLGAVGSSVGLVEGNEGEIASFDFTVHATRGTVFEGRAIGRRGRELPFVLSLADAIEVRGVPVDLRLQPADPTARLLWTVDLAAALSHVDWAEGPLDDGVIDDRDPGAQEALAYGLAEIGTWHLEAR
jgi:hypothetical protein